MDREGSQAYALHGSNHDCCANITAAWMLPCKLLLALLDYVSISFYAAYSRVYVPPCPRARSGSSRAHCEGSQVHAKYGSYAASSREHRGGSNHVLKTLEQKGHGWTYHTRDRCAGAATELSAVWSKSVLHHRVWPLSRCSELDGLCLTSNVSCSGMRLYPIMTLHHSRGRIESLSVTRWSERVATCPHLLVTSLKLAAAAVWLM